VEGDPCVLPEDNSILLLGIPRGVPCSQGHECTKAAYGELNHLKPLLTFGSGVCKKTFEVSTTRKFCFKF